MCQFLYCYKICPCCQKLFSFTTFPISVHNTTLCFLLVFGSAIRTVPDAVQLGQCLIIFSSFLGMYQHRMHRIRYFFHRIPHALHRWVPSSASRHSGVLLVPQEAHSFSTWMGITPKSSSQSGDELSGESSLSSLHKLSGLEDQEVVDELNNRTGVLHILRLPERRTWILESELGWDLGRFRAENKVSVRESGVNSSMLTERFIPDRTLKMTPLKVGSDRLALFNGRSGFLGVIRPLGDWRGVNCGVAWLTSSSRLPMDLSSFLSSKLLMVSKLYLCLNSSSHLQK